MTQEEKRKLEKQLAEKNYKQSSSNPNQWNNGSSKVIFDSSNGFNSDGDKRRTYGTCKNYLDKNK